MGKKKSEKEKTSTRTPDRRMEKVGMKLTVKVKKQTWGWAGGRIKALFGCAGPIPLSHTK